MVAAPFKRNQKKIKNKKRNEKKENKKKKSVIRVICRRCCVGGKCGGIHNRYTQQLTNNFLSKTNSHSNRFFFELGSTNGWRKNILNKR